MTKRFIRSRSSFIYNNSITQYLTKGDRMEKKLYASNC